MKNNGVSKSKKNADQRFPIVGIGASAGGLAAFETLFSSMPPDADIGMAFVLVQHLAPDRKSILSDIVRSHTCMQVFEAEDGMQVNPNSVYILPPNHDMAILNGVLQLLEPSSPRGQRLPIDFFFRTLAEDMHERAICILLSGTGNDGSLGVRAIKGEEGLVIVQDPETAEHSGMLRSAIETGFVDYVLPINEMPRQLVDYAIRTFGKRRGPESVPAPRADNALKKIFIVLRSRTGNDFSQYKISTIYRRIERRMAINQIETMDNYVTYLQQSQAEADALYNDLLIGVTHFFRDTDAFRTLAEIGIPKLFAGKQDGSPIRVWIPCCSTGEEAYSIAILLCEYMEARGLGHAAQIFATDIDARAISIARAGVYPASIASDVLPERLARFFAADPVGSTYRINKSVRDMLIFSEQNVVKDPPFSRLDLLSCRNFLIYLGKDLQKKLINLFHYSLNPGGILFLGNSENVSESESMFAILDHKARLFQSVKTYSGLQRATVQFSFPITAASAITALTSEAKKEAPAKKSVRDIVEEALLHREDMAGALVNKRGDIIYLHGRTGLFLEPAPGEAEMNILKMSREGLKFDLTKALYKAIEKKEITRCSGLQVKTNGQFTAVNLSVHPLTPESAGSSPLYLVVLEKVAQYAGEEPAFAAMGESDEDIRIESLKKQLRAKEEYLQAANEELETANEELSSSNEEMQSINEELQSTNEELETSREELQSINEELATVNVELQSKVNELSRLNNDMNNMLSGTGVGTVFVDHQLRIMRFTPAATEIINLIPGDIGRPVAHIVSNLDGYGGLASDLDEVLRALVKKEVEVRTHAGRWYMMRIQPYRTLDNVIEGAVITFSDITEAKEVKYAKEALAVSELYFRRLFETAREGILILDAQTGMIKRANRFITDMLGYTEEQLVMKKIWDLGFFRDVIANKEKFLELQQNAYVRYDDLPLETVDGHQIDVEFISSVYMVGQETVIQCSIRDITHYKEMKEALTAVELRFARLLKAAREGALPLDLEDDITA